MAGARAGSEDGTIARPPEGRPEELLRSADPTVGVDLMKLGVRLSPGAARALVADPEVARALAEAQRGEDAPSAAAPIDPAVEAQARQEAAAAEEARLAFEARTQTMRLASYNLGRAVSVLTEMGALITWQPDRTAAVVAAVGDVARILEEFRSNIVSAAAFEAPAQAHDPGEALPTVYAQAVAEWRELHRQVGAQIALLESDAGNIPALTAMERAVSERVALVSLRSQGLGYAIGRMGLAR
jgi:hypothetical protein